MSAETMFFDIPGGRELVHWFGCVPRFHDATLLGINLASDGPSSIRIQAFRMTDEVDDKGYYVLDRHVVVTVTLESVSHVDLSNFNLPGIIFNLDFLAIEGQVQLDWISSHGVEGIIRAKKVRLDLQPGIFNPNSSGD